MSFRFRVWDRLPQTSHDWPELGRVLSFQGDETISSPYRYQCQYIGSFRCNSLSLKRSPTPRLARGVVQCPRFAALNFSNWTSCEVNVYQSNRPADQSKDSN